MVVSQNQDSGIDARRCLDARLAQLSGALDRLADQPGYRFASVYSAAISELRVVAGRLPATTNEDVHDWVAVERTIASLQAFFLNNVK